MEQHRLPEKVHQALNPPFPTKLKSTISAEMGYLLTPSENLPTTQPWNRQLPAALFYGIDTLMNAMLEGTLGSIPQSKYP